MMDAHDDDHQPDSVKPDDSDNEAGMTAPPDRRTTPVTQASDRILDTDTDIDTDTKSDAAPDTDPAIHDEQGLGEFAADEPLADDAEADFESGDPYGGQAPDAVKRIMEGALFAAGTALSIAQIAALFENHERPHRSILRALMSELVAAYQGGGVELAEVASGFRLQTSESIGLWVSRLWEERPQRYSRALLETIALIAYRQPITRGEIEEVRGVSVSTQIVRTLLEREWVRIVGHRDVPGRPAMYATTRQFLDHFGLSRLDQLPSLGEIRDLDHINPQLGLEGDDDRSVGSVDSQAEISFSSMVDKLREGDRSGKTGNTFIDEQLDGELSEMDAVNEAIEQSFEDQRAGHNHPDLELTDDDDASSQSDDFRAVNEDATTGSEVNNPGSAGRSAKQGDASAPRLPPNHDALSETEKWQIIQEKLAQQQAWLDGRESDQPGGDDDNEH